MVVAAVRHSPTFIGSTVGCGTDTVLFYLMITFINFEGRAVRIWADGCLQRG